MPTYHASGHGSTHAIFLLFYRRIRPSKINRSLAPPIEAELAASPNVIPHNLPPFRRKRRNTLLRAYPPPALAVQTIIPNVRYNFKGTSLEPGVSGLSCSVLLPVNAEGEAHRRPCWRTGLSTVGLIYSGRKMFVGVDGLLLAARDVPDVRSGVTCVKDGWAGAEA